MRRFSSTLRSAKVPRPWGTWAMPRRTIASAGALVMSLPSNTIEPERSIIPETARMVVVLPAPLAPSTTTTSPPPTVRSISWSTLTAPYPARTALSSSKAVTRSPELSCERRGASRGATNGGLAAELHRHHPVGDAHHHRHVMLHEQHGEREPLADLEDRVGKLVDLA